MKIVQIVGATLVAGTAVCVARWLAWRRTNERLISLLYQPQQVVSDPTTLNSPETRQKLYNELPSVVKRYLNKALNGDRKFDLDKIRMIQSLRMEQNGSMLLGESWHSFHAVQDVSAVHSNPGFLWDATFLLPVHTPSVGDFPCKSVFEIPVNVRDAYVQGKGDLDARLLRILTLAHIENNPDINEGELMRWMGEATLVPTALLPSESLSWEAVDGDPMQAKLHFMDGILNTTGELLITFDASDLVQSVEGTRAKAVGNSLVHARWTGRMLEYQTHNGMLVPYKMEVGWWTDGSLDIYWKGGIVALNYTFSST